MQEVFGEFFCPSKRFPGFGRKAIQVLHAGYRVRCCGFFMGTPSPERQELHRLVQNFSVLGKLLEESSGARSVAKFRFISGHCDAQAFLSFPCVETESQALKHVYREGNCVWKSVNGSHCWTGLTRIVP